MACSVPPLQLLWSIVAQAWAAVAAGGFSTKPLTLGPAVLLQGHSSDQVGGAGLGHVTLRTARTPQQHADWRPSCSLTHLMVRSPRARKQMTQVRLSLRQCHHFWTCSRPPCRGSTAVRQQCLRPGSATAATTYAICHASSSMWGDSFGYTYEHRKPVGCA